MRENVEVLNRGREAYSEKFEDREITIAAGDKIVMGRREAVKFVGGHAGMDPKTGTMRIKNLEIIPIEKAPAAPAPKYICNQCGLEWPSQEDLDRHVKTAHAGQQYTDKRLEKKAEEAKAAEGAKCPFCDFVGKNKAGLRIHLANCKGADIPAQE